MGCMGPETLLADPGEAQEGVGQKGGGLGVRRRGQTGNKAWTPGGRGPRGPSGDPKAHAFAQVQ